MYFLQPLLAPTGYPAWFAFEKDAGRAQCCGKNYQKMPFVGQSNITFALRCREHAHAWPTTARVGCSSCKGSAAEAALLQIRALRLVRCVERLKIQSVTSRNVLSDCGPHLLRGTFFAHPRRGFTCVRKVQRAPGPPLPWLCTCLLRRCFRP